MNFFFSFLFCTVAKAYFHCTFLTFEMPEKFPIVNTCLVIQEIIRNYLLQISIIVQLVGIIHSRKRKRMEIEKMYSMINRIPDQVKRLHKMIGVTDVDCMVNLRMERNTFGRLCVLLRDLGGLVDGKYVSVEEQVALFLGILSHHKKNRVVGFDFCRSGQTISHYLHVVLIALLKLHGILLVKPQPVTDDCDDPRWKWFKVYIFMFSFFVLGAECL